ncbi:MAG: UDP-N-acetylglucosamine pyrophosphorylase [Oscillospiraceae bacterium]|nr:UDP-N-acetylglucosamine pyrophosphorylase [Oscillospiraceae bacterium]
MIKTSDLLDLRRCAAGKYLENFEYPWQALPGIHDMILKLAKTLGEEYIQRVPMVWVHSTARIARTAFLEGPCIIGANSEVRHCAFIRGAALVGENCVVGNSVEVKNAILFDGVQIPHFNYVGDSILGHKAHLGAGAVTSNVKSDHSLVTVRKGEKRMETRLRKFGALVGDFAEVGCNAVLNPGTVVGRNSVIYPNSCVRGVVPEESIWKNGGVVVKKE